MSIRRDKPTRLLQATVSASRGLSPMNKPLVLLRTLAAIVLLVAGLAMSALAITYGQLDGNRHPNVGALLYDWDPTHPGLDEACSGTLIAPTVFLTAAHCDPDRSVSNDEVWISFDADVDPVTSATTLYHGIFVPDPEFDWNHPLGSDTHDVAVLLLDTPVAGITPAQLPQPGLLDQLKATGVLSGLKFTAVGYGISTVTFGGGRPRATPDDGARRYAVSDFLALRPAWLVLSQNPHTGDGGSCAGDSGGPHFLGADTTETNIIVSTTVTGGGICNSTSVTYRLDTESARSFLGDYVTLP